MVVQAINVCEYQAFTLSVFARKYMRRHGVPCCCQSEAAEKKNHDRLGKERCFFIAWNRPRQHSLS